jgi:arylsulfatase A-like enzyme
MVSWNPPHPPFNPPPNDQAPYAGTMKKRPNVEITGRGPGPLHSEAKWHEAVQGYYGGITGIDLEFARMLKTLDEIGQADNTIVVYTADHGEMMGSQGRMSKQVPYEESCRVPFSVRYPGVTKNGSSSDMLFAAIDIFPTLCGLAGVAAPKTCVGRDHSTVMRGGKMEPSEMVFLMNGGANELAGRKAKGRKGGAALPGNEAEGDIEGKAPAYRGLRTKTHTYAVDTAGRWMLHDNVADPYQMKNLANDPSQKALMESFDVALLQWMKMTGDPFQWPKLT